MNTAFDLDRLTGSWDGHYKLWLGPTEPVRESDTQATVAAAAGGRFLVLTYTWDDRGAPHDGVLIVRVDSEPSPVDMVWVDSFHTMGKFMQFEGRASDLGTIEATTTWSVGDGPDWGWRIAVSSQAVDELLVQMYIATPTGEEAPAVEARYQRVGAPRA